MGQLHVFIVPIIWPWSNIFIRCIYSSTSHSAVAWPSSKKNKQTQAHPFEQCQDATKLRPTLSSEDRTERLFPSGDHSDHSDHNDHLTDVVETLQCLGFLEDIADKVFFSLGTNFLQKKVSLEDVRRSNLLFRKEKKWRNPAVVLWCQGS